MQPTIDDLHTIHAAACVTFKAARNAFDRSRSARNRAAFAAADAAHEAASIACRNEIGRMQEADRLAARLAATEARRAQRARQFDLFA